MTKIFKTKSYRVAYKNSNGVDHFSGRYILENSWLLNMVKQGTARITKI